MLSKEYYEINKDKFCERSRTWYDKNSERILNRMKIYNETIKEQKSLYNKQYYQDHKEFLKQKQNARNRENWTERYKYFVEYKKKHEDQLREYMRAYKEKRRREQGIPKRIPKPIVIKNHDVNVYSNPILDFD